MSTTAAADPVRSGSTWPSRSSAPQWALEGSANMPRAHSSLGLRSVRHPRSGTSSVRAQTDDGAPIATHSGRMGCGDAKPSPRNPPQKQARCKMRDTAQPRVPRDPPSRSHAPKSARGYQCPREGPEDTRSIQSRVSSCKPHSGFPLQGLSEQFRFRRAISLGVRMLLVLLGTTNNYVTTETVRAYATSHIGAWLSPRVYNLRHPALRKTARKCRL